MADNSSVLCGACGLCCTGLLHHSVEVRSADVERVRRLALLVEPTEKGTWTFPLPCVRHEGDRCGVYASRPRACQDYRCMLLRRVEEGETTVEAGLARVATVKTLLDRCRALVGDDVSWRGLQREVGRRWNTRGIEDGATRQEHTELTMLVAALDVLLADHFRTPADQAGSG